MHAPTDAAQAALHRARAAMPRESWEALARKLELPATTTKAYAGIARRPKRPSVDRAAEVCESLRRLAVELEDPRLAITLDAWVTPVRRSTR